MKQPSRKKKMRSPCGFLLIQLFAATSLCNLLGSGVYCFCPNIARPPSLFGSPESRNRKQRSLSPSAGMFSPSSMALSAHKKKKRVSKKKKKSSGGGSNDGDLLEPIMKFMFPPTSSSSSSNPVESSVETALMLVDKKRQAEFKKDLQKQFPFVPQGIVDTCVDSLANSFKAVAPSKLKQALEPGGFQTVRPELEDTIVSNLQKQPMIQDLPLSKSDKTKILKYMVSMAFDYLFQDVEEILKDPKERLQTLDNQRRQIQRFMTKRQVLLYRIQYHPIPMTLVLVSTILSSLYLYQLLLEKTTIMPTVTSFCLSIITAIQSPIKTFKAFGITAKSQFKDYLSLMGIVKATRRRAIRRPR